MPTVKIVDLRRRGRAIRSRRRCSRSWARSRRTAARRSCCSTGAGVAPALHCRACGVSRRCPNCDVALRLHRDGKLHCHHCGYAEDVPEACPACGSIELARIGAGTQRLERSSQKHVPELERIRLDADTSARRGSLQEALERFAAADRAVLIGTQMVAKGHHFPGVALAAVVDADTGLALPDFRAEERTFQLVTQLAGRSGRDAPGKVIVQTFQPDATPLAFAARHDVAGFLAEELERRRELGYPPFGHLVPLVATGADAAAPDRLLRELRAELGGGELPGELLGPAPLLRLRGRHRAQLVAKTDRPRALAAQAARLLVGGRARDAQGRRHRGRRRRPPIRLGVAAVPRPSEGNAVLPGYTRRHGG